MGLGGGKGRGGGKGGKGGKGLGSILGNIPIAGGMINGIGSQLPMVGGMFNQPGMMGSSMGGMNPMMSMLGGKFGNMFGMPMRGMGPMPLTQMHGMREANGSQSYAGQEGQPAQPGQEGQPSQGNRLWDFPSQGTPGVYDNPFQPNQPPQQGGVASQIGAVGSQGSGGVMPTLGAAPGRQSGGAPFSFQQPQSSGVSNSSFGAGPSFNPYGGGTPFQAPGGGRQSQFFDPRVNR